MVKKLSKWLFLEPFVYTKESLHLRDISRKLGISHATVRTYLNEFEQEGILKKEYKGRLTLYRLNKAYSRQREVLEIVEKERVLVFCKKYIIADELVSLLREKTTHPIIIFGSSAINYKKAKDIDILTTDKTIDVKKINKTIQKKIHLITVDSLDDVREALKEEVLKKHIVVSGIEKVIRWLR